MAAKGLRFSVTIGPLCCIEEALGNAIRFYKEADVDAVKPEGGRSCGADRRIDKNYGL